MPGPQTPIFGLPFEKSNKIAPGATLDGGPDGKHPILAEIVEEILLSRYRIDQGEYTPELTAPTTNPDLGSSGSTTGRWHRVGFLITAWVEWRYDGTGVSGGSGIHEISLPFPADTSIMQASGDKGVGSALGSGVYDASSGELVTPYLHTGGATARLALSTGVVDEDSPAVPGADTEVAIMMTYIADPDGLP